VVSARFLLDTNILSEPCRPDPSRRVLERLHRHQGEMATAAPVWHELLFGHHRLPLSPKRTAIGRYLREVVAPAVDILPYDAAAADWHASERARLVTAGQTPAFVDGQIAAIAMTRHLIIVTRNVDDYQPFAGVRIANWFE
jgi:tRNA(fMet)-specific endonuclease VapC